MKNTLHLESSPYLQQHKDNPVHWQAWGQTALEIAEKEDKLLVVSIGYSTCHWCHVMEHESFEDESVARLMNAYFVNIKVDREERPDVDQLYMDACQLITGNGGWPLNAIALPDGRPIYAGTYFPTDRWKQILAYFARMYREDKPKLLAQAQRLQEGYSLLDKALLNEGEEAKAVSLDDALGGWNTWRGTLDTLYGGRNGAPKFMMPGSWLFLQDLYAIEPSADKQRAIALFLNRLAVSGTSDQLAGGFSRYSTDVEWKVPHFEKMLYDNAQLLSLYARAYAMQGIKQYKRSAQGIVDWLTHEMKAPDGGFYAATDADSEGEEGRYFVWTLDEMRELLPQADTVIDYYNITAEGNWEDGKNVLHATQLPEDFAREHGIDSRRFNRSLKEAQEVLLTHRKKRIAPSVDTKVITAWNAMLITGFLDAYRYAEMDEALVWAEHTAELLADRIEGKVLYRLTGKDKRVEGFLDDYAFTIDAFTQCYEVTGKSHYLNNALALCQSVVDMFAMEGSPYLRYSNPREKALFRQKVEQQDNVIPSSNAVMAWNFVRLGNLIDSKEYIERSLAMVKPMLSLIRENASFAYMWGRVLLQHVESIAQVAVTGPKALTLGREMQRNPQPFVVYSLVAEEGEGLEWSKSRWHADSTRLFICRNKVCKRPVAAVEEVFQERLLTPVFMK